MDWISVGKQVVAAGAPTIGAALGGPIGAQVGSVLATVLGVDATPAAVGDAVAADPARIEQVEAAPGADLTGWLMLHAQMAAGLATSEAARESWFSWAWRPAMSWLLIVLWAWALLVQPLLEAMTHLGIPAVPYDQLLGLSGIWLAIYGGGHTLKSIMGKG